MIMLLVFNCLLNIGELKFNFCSEIRVRSSWKEMTQTAVISQAKKILVKDVAGNLNRLEDVIKVGDPVIIQIGYNGKYNTEFVGYVSRDPKRSMPVEITCEDEMWKLKKRTVDQKVFANGKLSDLVKYIAPGYSFEIFDTQLGTNYSCLDEAFGTAAGALKKVEDTFGLKSFFRNVADPNSPGGVKPVLVIGRPYSSPDLTNLPVVEYKLKQNTKVDSLLIKTAETDPVQIVGISKIDDGKDLRSVYPKVIFDGSKKTRHWVGINQAMLDKNVKDEWIKANHERYEGSVTGFAFPFVRHGMVVNVLDELYDPTNRQHFVDAVDITVSVSEGVKRIVTLGYAVTAEARQTSK